MDGFAGLPRPTAQLVPLFENDRLIRVKPYRPLTPMESIVVTLLGWGENYVQIAERLSVGRRTIKFHTRNAAEKLPGDLPAQMRVVAWYRGATADVLTGDPMKGNFAPPRDGRAKSLNEAPPSRGLSWQRNGR